jgi:hypothetical protein
MQASEEQGLLVARRLLRDQQKAAAERVGMAPQGSGEGTGPAALAELRRVYAFEDTADPATVRRGPFRFGREAEERRIAVAADIITRSDPGPYEDAVYLALLAYQAASVAMAYAPLSDPPMAPPHFARFLLGSIPSTEVNAFATVHKRSGYTVVEVNAALLDFIYQSAKAVVAAQRPMRAADSGGITAHGDLDRVRAALDADDAPAARLFASLEAYLYHGSTRPVRQETVPEEYSPPLSLLVAQAERFVVAHEYGHGVMERRDTTDSHLSPAWTAELLADNFAMFATVISAIRLDSLPPEFALSGAVFALACLDLLTRAVAAARYGEVPADEASESHPPFAWRVARVLEGFHQMFDVEYGEPTRMPRVTIVDPSTRRTPPDEDVRRTVEQRATAQTDILFLLWDHVLPRLLREHGSGRRLHPMWYPAS